MLRQVNRLLCDDSPAARSFQEALSAGQCSAAPPLQLWHPTQLSDAQLEQSPLGRQAIGEALHLFLSQSGHDGAAARTADGPAAGTAVPRTVSQAVAGDSAGQPSFTAQVSTVAIVISCGRAAALLHGFCGLSQESTFAVDVLPASISVIDAAPADIEASPAGGPRSLADGANVHTVYCVNSRAHLALAPNAADAAAGGAANASDM